MVYIALLLLGLCFGSFVNALVWRIYQKSLPHKRRAASQKELSIATGRSMCPHCKHTLHAKDLLPVVSWLLLKGKCRYCKKPIGWQYLLVEVVTAVLFVVSYVFWPFEFDVQGLFLIVVWLISLVAFMALAVYDIRWMLLPNSMVFPLIGLGVMQTIMVSLLFGGGVSYLISVIAAVAIAGGIFYVLFQLSGGSWIGGGDVKLGYALGLLLATPGLAFLMLFTASLLGVAVALPGLITKRNTVASKIPFGPYLMMATFICMLFGQQIIDWYMSAVLGVA